MGLVVRELGLLVKGLIRHLARQVRRVRGQDQAQGG